MEFFAPAARRFSALHYAPIALEALEKILRAGLPAPTARSLQLRRLLVLTKPEDRTALQLPFAAGVAVPELSR